MNLTFLEKRSLILLALTMLLVSGLVLTWAARPVMASPVAQQATGTVTVTLTLTPTVTNTLGTGTGTVTVTVTPTGSTTPGAGTITRTPTRTPFVFRSPTMLAPVTGGEMADGEVPPNAGTWVAVWLLGLLLVAYGVRAKLVRR